MLPCRTDCPFTDPDTAPLESCAISRQYHPDSELGTDPTVAVPYVGWYLQVPLRNTMNVRGACPPTGYHLSTYLAPTPAKPA